MVEHALGEGLSSGVGPEVGGEAEGLVDGQVGLDVEHGGAHDLGLLEHVATATVEDAVDAADGVLGTLKKEKQRLIQAIQHQKMIEISHLDLDQVDGLHEPGRGGERARVEAPPGGGDDLSAAPVDGVGVQGHVVDVEADAAHVLVAEHTLGEEILLV